MKRYTLLLLACWWVGVPATPGLASPTVNIEWLHWGESAFDQARTQNKLILLDVGTEWCSACNQMFHETYADPEVQALLRQHYVTVHVDAEAEPDLGERYGFWGWPALIFIRPDGEHVGFFRGYRPPDVFRGMLDNFQRSFMAGELSAPQIEVDLVSRPSDEEFEKILGLGRRMLDRFYDVEHHGWGGSRMPDAYLLQQAWWRAENPDENTWRERAYRSSEQYLKMLDPVWGGIWFGSRSPDYSGSYIHERRSDHQAAAFSIFAWAYRVDRQQRWLDAINDIDRYLERFMKSDQGLYFTSQEMHVYTEDGETLDPEAYFALDDAARRQLGMPAIDRSIYTDINARLVVAMADVFQATGDERWRDRSVALIQKIQQAGNDDGSYRQLLSAPEQAHRMRRHLDSTQALTYLRTQALTGLAQLAGFEITGDRVYLDNAKRIARVMINRLRDQKSGGLLARFPPAAGADGKPLRDQPLVDAGAAADFLIRLATFLYGAFDDDEKYDSEHYHQFAEQALRAVAGAERLRVQGYFIGQYLLALQQWRDELIQVSVVCQNTLSKTCQDLKDRVLVNMYHPRRIVKLQAPDSYPEQGEAALYICTSRLCSSPMQGDEDGLEARVAEWYARLISIAE